jgi:hypothetical protein
MQAPGLVLAGMTNVQIGMQKWWAGQRAIHGDKGYSQTTLDKIKQRLRKVHAAARIRTHCAKGHAFTVKNVWLDKRNNRHCKICKNLRHGGRPRWIEVDGVRTSIEAHDKYFFTVRKKLYKAMADVHPDKGGTSRKFREAKKVFDRFLTTETAWYAQHSLTLPSRFKRKGDCTPQTAVVKNEGAQCSQSI